MPINDVVVTGIEAVASWCTPACLFCFVNLMIGTIYLRSTLNPLRKQQYSNDDQRRPQIDRVPSFLQRVKSINLSRQPDPRRPQLDRVPSFLQRVKSINLSRQPDPLPHVTRTSSDTTVKRKAPVRVLEKSASEKLPEDKEEMDEIQRRPATAREKTAAAGDEAVDAKADDFINRFRQQLKLQRLDSILRYKEILDRGTAR